jgi:hypothetical protein
LEDFSKFEKEKLMQTVLVAGAPGVGGLYEFPDVLETNLRRTGFEELG